MGAVQQRTRGALSYERNANVGVIFDAVVHARIKRSVVSSTVYFVPKLKWSGDNCVLQSARLCYYSVSKQCSVCIIIFILIV